MSDAVYVCPECDFAGCHCPRSKPTADRIASAPKAWARVTESGELRVIGLESFTPEQAKSFADGYGIKLVRVALVEIPEEK